MTPIVRCDLPPGPPTHACYRCDLPIIDGQASCCGAGSYRIDMPPTRTPGQKEMETWNR